MTLRRSICLGLSAALTATLAACSTEQLYGGGQAWRRNECYKIDDMQQRSRCLAEASTSQAEYQRQVDAVRPTTP